MQFQIVDKTEDGAAALGVKVIFSHSNDLSSRQTIKRGAQRAPAIRRRRDKLEGGNRVSRIYGIARHTIWR